MLLDVYKLQGHTVYHCLYIIPCIKFLVLVKALQGIWRLKSNPCLSPYQYGISSVISQDTPLGQQHCATIRNFLLAITLLKNNIVIQSLTSGNIGSSRSLILKYKDKCFTGYSMYLKNNSINGCNTIKKCNSQFGNISKVRTASI